MQALFNEFAKHQSKPAGVSWYHKSKVAALGSFFNNADMH